MEQTERKHYFLQRESLKIKATIQMLKRENNRTLIFFVFKKFDLSFSNKLEEKRAVSVRNTVSSIVKRFIR